MCIHLMLSYLSFAFHQGQPCAILSVTVLHFLTCCSMGMEHFSHFALFLWAHNRWSTLLRSLGHTYFTWEMKRTLRNYWKYSKAFNLDLCSKFNSVLSRLFVYLACLSLRDSQSKEYFMAWFNKMFKSINRHTCMTFFFMV